MFVLSFFLGGDVVEGGIECCDMRGTGPLPKSLQHHSCSPIDIPEMDRFYARYGQKCMNFVRSMTVTREDCSLGPANQVISLIIMIFSLILSRE